jgi:hypothetical protein
MSLQKQNEEKKNKEKEKKDNKRTMMTAFAMAYGYPRPMSRGTCDVRF